MTLGTVALAGCSGDGSGDGDSSGGDDDGNSGTDGEDGSDSAEDSAGGDSDGSGETDGSDGSDGSDGADGADSNDGSGEEGEQTQDGAAGREPITFSGTGSSSGETVQMQEGLVVAESSHGGSGRFEISLEGGQFPLVIASADGGFDGKEATYTEAREYTLNVVADGSWEVTIRQPRADSGESLPATYTGSGSDVVGPVDLSSDGTARFSHSGQFAVQVTVYPQIIDIAGPILFRSFGEFEDDTIYAGNGISWIDIDADGPWTLELE